MMVHRWQVATDYFKTVLKPQLKGDAERLPRRFRTAMRSEGRWLAAPHRERLQAYVASRPQLATLVEYRRRLLAIYEMKSAEADIRMEALRAWCREAEASGNEALQAFSVRLKGYALVPTRT
jgi:stearoyl-CoA desaturase (delta-9 desaturase)